MQSRFMNYASYALYGDSGNTSWTEVDQFYDYVDMLNYELYKQFYDSTNSEYFNNLSKLLINIFKSLTCWMH